MPGIVRRRRREKLAAFRRRMVAYGDPEELARQAPTTDPLADLPLFSQRANPAEDRIDGAVSS